MMNVRQIAEKEALKLYVSGQNIMILRPTTICPFKWTDYDTTTLEDELEGCMFFCEALASEPESNGTAESDNEPDEACHEAADLESSSMQEADQTLQKPGRKKPRLDTGKVIALHNAGWTLADIASEMKCSIHTITRCLNKEDMKNGDKQDSESVYPV